MKQVFVAQEELLSAVAAVKEGVPSQFLVGRKTLGERTKGLSSFFAISNVCAEGGCSSVEVHPDNPGNQREALTNSFVKLFCDSRDGSRGMIRLGEISSGSRKNRNRFSSDVLTGSFAGSPGNTKFEYPREPLRLLQIEQIEESANKPTRLVSFCEGWDSSLAKYLTTPSAWKGLIVFMLRDAAFQASKANGEITNEMLVSKIRDYFTGEVAEFLAVAAKLKKA